MKRFFEIIILLVLAAALGTGFYNLCKSNEEPKDENPIVDVLPGDDEEQEPSEDEVELKEVKLNFGSTTGPYNYFPMITYYDGCTWRELIEYNDSLRISDDGTKIIFPYDNGTDVYDFILKIYNGNQDVTPDMVFDANTVYILSNL